MSTTGDVETFEYSKREFVIMFRLNKGDNWETACAYASDKFAAEGYDVAGWEERRTYRDWEDARAGI